MGEGTAAGCVRSGGTAGVGRRVRGDAAADGAAPVDAASGDGTAEEEAPAPPASGISFGSAAMISTPPSTRRLEMIRASGPRARRTCLMASRVVIPKNRLIFTLRHSHQ